MLALPLAHSPINITSPVSATPYGGIALAGHVMPGGRWCPCDCPECPCDHGSTGCTYNVTVERDSTSDAPESETIADPDSEIGSGALLTALLVLLWIRFRA